jgi:hypothetical protein
MIDIVMFRAGFAIQTKHETLSALFTLILHDLSRIESIPAKLLMVSLP